jgi:hypothetical protein
VRVLLDARRMLAEVRTVRRALADGAYGDLRRARTADPEAAPRFGGPGPVALTAQPAAPHA